jgi:hypothetical protein
MVGALYWFHYRCGLYIAACWDKHTPAVALTSTVVTCSELEDFAIQVAALQ